MKMTGVIVGSASLVIKNSSLMIIQNGVSGTSARIVVRSGQVKGNAEIITLRDGSMS